SGEPWSNGLSDDPQDYAVIPEQPWLDGFNVSEDFIRQFVAKRVFGLVIDFGTSQSPKSTRPLTTYWCPSRPG
ncbi:hypothetical protein, partial [Thiolapillus sp.]|uniref:hypothetical protein n=1 Tax=Thiolapillus sp. TaxID=2017437 RepID=UPI003AF6300E